jgi:hypothetical protein
LNIALSAVAAVVAATLAVEAVVERSTLVRLL